MKKNLFIVLVLFATKTFAQSPSIGLLKEINPTTQGSSLQIESKTGDNSKLFFTSFSYEGKPTGWKQITELGVYQSLNSVWNIPDTLVIDKFELVNDKIVFLREKNGEFQVWASDKQNLTLLISRMQGKSSQTITYLNAINNKIYIAGGINYGGYGGPQLWVTEGTTNSTVNLTNFAFSNRTTIRNIVSTSQFILFSLNFITTNGYYNFFVYKIDLVTNQLSLVTSSPTGDRYTKFTEFNNKIYYQDIVDFNWFFFDGNTITSLNTTNFYSNSGFRLNANNYVNSNDNLNGLSIWTDGSLNTPTPTQHFINSSLYKENNYIYCLVDSSRYGQIANPDLCIVSILPNNIKTTLAKISKPNSNIITMDISLVAVTNGFIVFNKNYTNKDYYNTCNQIQPYSELWTYNLSTGLLNKIYTSEIDNNSITKGIIGNTLFFQYSDKIHGTGLWKTNATNAGTNRVMNNDITANGNGVSGLNFSNVKAIVNDKLYFYANNGFKTILWNTDGTTTNTIPLNPLENSVSGYKRIAGIHKNKIFVNVQKCMNSQNDYSETNVKVINLPDTTLQNISGTGLEIYNLLSKGDSLYFTEFNLNTGNEKLYRSSTGNYSDKVLLKNGSPGLYGTSHIFRGHYYYIDYSNILKENSAGTLNVVNATTSIGNEKIITENNLYYYSTVIQNGNYIKSLKCLDTHDNEILISNNFQSFVGNIGSTIFFLQPNNNVNLGSDLWKTDGTVLGTVFVKNIGGTPIFCSQLGNKIVFGATNLWISDGSANGTNIISNTFDVNYSFNSNSTTFNNEVFFFTENGGSNFKRTLYKTDGQNLTKIKEYYESVIIGDCFTVINNNLLLNLSPALTGQEWYKYNSGICSFQETVKSGNWNDPTVWSCGVIPNETQNVVIKSGHNILLSNTMGIQKCKALTVELGSIFQNNGNFFLAKP